MWRFAQVPKGFWDQINNQRQYFDWLSSQLGIQHLQDWSKLRSEDVEKNGPAILSRYYGRSLFRALSAIYPGNTVTVIDTTI